MASDAHPLPGRTARTVLACLDLTSLNDTDTEATVARLCERAAGPHGPVAAVCVWPRFAAFARSLLPASIRVAAVANFPTGTGHVRQAVRETAQIAQAGAQEVDVVLPWRALVEGEERGCAELLLAVRRACEGLTLKVILETGALQYAQPIQRASRIALDTGADFLKTSTGRVAVHATPAAAQVMLETIGADPSARDRVGFKASGGIRTLADAAVYAGLAERHFGAQAMNPGRFRIGASSLLDAVETELSNAERGEQTQRPAHAEPSGGPAAAA